MDLDKLLTDALRRAKALKFAGLPVAASLECRRIHDEAKRQYLDQKKWSVGDLVELVYTDASGELSSLGTFREYQYRPRQARKLVREGGESADRVEFVYGSHWVEAVQPPLWESTPLEVLELRERFDELMREV